MGALTIARFHDKGGNCYEPSPYLKTFDKSVSGDDSRTDCCGVRFETIRKFVSREDQFVKKTVTNCIGTPLSARKLADPDAVGQAYAAGLEIVSGCDCPGDEYETERFYLAKRV